MLWSPIVVRKSSGPVWAPDYTDDVDDEDEHIIRNDRMMRTLEGKDYHHDYFLLWLNNKWSDFPNQSYYKNHKNRWQWPALPGPIWQGGLREECACLLGRSLGQSIILVISNINVTIYIVIIIHQNHHIGKSFMGVTLRVQYTGPNSGILSIF